MSGEMLVRHLADDRFAIDVRGHTLTVDQLRGDGGEDTAPTPTELFVAGLASCVAFYARRYCARHGIDPAGLEVHIEYRIGGRPAKVDRIAVRITPPAALPAGRRARCVPRGRLALHRPQHPGRPAGGPDRARVPVLSGTSVSA